MDSTFDWQAWETLAGTFEPGTVALVGAGPGDGALISVRGACRLMQADAVLHDFLIGPELLALVRASADVVLVGKRRGEHVWSQTQINRELARRARIGQRVVRLKGGDPFVFGRGGEECAYLTEAGVRYEVVPGITAAFGAPATAGIPLTHRGLSRSFALVTGHADEKDPHPLDFAALARMETLVLYMGVDRLEANCRGLIDAGMAASTPVAVIRWGTRAQQRTIVGTLGDIADRVASEGLEAPAMVLVGQVVRLREQIEWFEGRPLFGQTIAVTRTPGQASRLAGMLTSLGAAVCEAPTLAIAEVDDVWAVDRALRQIETYRWLVLTSANGVAALFARLAEMGLDTRALGAVRIAAVGSATARALAEHGIRADLVPPEAVGESLAGALIDRGMVGVKVLLLRGDLARPTVPDLLREAGALCDDLPVYRTVCPAALPESFVEQFDAGGIDWITLTSPSSWANLRTLLGEQRQEAFRRVRLASIGPVTTRAVEADGFAVAVEADPHDVNGLVRAIVDAVKG